MTSDLSHAAAVPAAVPRSAAAALWERPCRCGEAATAGDECADCRARRLGVRPLVDSSRPRGDQQDAGPTPAPAPGVFPPSPPSPATPAPAAPPCARPVNFRHFNPRDNGPDGIRVDITYESSTGNLADLSNCKWREVVDYDPIPNPPFLWNPPNPTIIEIPATSGSGMDTHSYPPGLKTGITDPRESGTMTAHQVYQWHCTAPGCPADWTDFPGQRYTITREVFPEYVRLNPWRYEVTKTGVGNPFNYSREVEIPEP